MPRTAAERGLLDPFGTTILDDPGQYLRAREAEAMWTHAGPDTFPNGCMIAEVEVDPETGVVKIDRVCSVDDACVAINPLWPPPRARVDTVQDRPESIRRPIP
jgi:CO/xanthine dehydrogenase Mo-binding subunit